MVSKLLLGGPFTIETSLDGATSVEYLILGALAIVVLELPVEKLERNIKTVQVEAEKKNPKCGLFIPWWTELGLGISWH